MDASQLRDAADKASEIQRIDGLREKLRAMGDGRLSVNVGDRIGQHWDGFDVSSQRMSALLSEERNDLAKSLLDLGVTGVETKTV
jgi:hypothetical protein